eukprot:scaffold41923_cov75-Attheya_sp.AAC.1
MPPYVHAYCVSTPRYRLVLQRTMRSRRITDAKDAGAAEAFAPVWAPSSSEDVAVTAAEGVAASVESAVVKIAEGAGSSKDFAHVLAHVRQYSSYCLDPSYLPSVTGIGQAVINSLF